MKNNKVTLQSNEQELLECAKKEKRIKASDFLAEIQPLLASYFLGQITYTDRSITYCMPNGQVFKLSAKTVG